VGFANFGATLPKRTNFTMNIQTTRPLQPKTTTSVSNAPAKQDADTPSLPTDSVTFGGGGGEGLKNAAFFGGLGVVPLVGAGTNGMAAWATAWDDASRENSSGRPTIGLVGAAANLAGTVTTTVGLFTGSDTTKMVGLGLLGVSGLAGAALGLSTK
jgi:hypothetical protein